MFRIRGWHLGAIACAGLSLLARNTAATTPTEEESPVALALVETAIEGSWYFAEKDVTISIYKTEVGWQGKSIQAPKPELVNKWVVRNMKFDASAGTYKGTLVPPDADRNVDATLSLRDANTLDVKGTVLLFTKSFTWTRKATP